MYVTSNNRILNVLLCISILLLSTFQIRSQPKTDFLNRAENFIDINFSNDRYNPDLLAIWFLGTQLLDFCEPDFLREPTKDSVHIRLIYQESWNKPILIRASGTKTSPDSWILTVKEERDNSLTLDDFQLEQLTNREKRALKKSIENLEHNSRTQIDSIFRRLAIEDSLEFKFSEQSKIMDDSDMAELLKYLNTSNFYDLEPVIFHPAITHGTTASLEVLQPSLNFHLVIRHIVLDQHPELNQLTRFLLDLANEQGMVKGEISDW